MSTQFTFIRPMLPFRIRVNLGAMAIKGGTPYSPKLQHYWSLTNRLFSVISRPLVEWVSLTPQLDAVGVFYHPSRPGNLTHWYHSVAIK